MSYQTGTAASASALLTIIKTFATDNGWTNSTGNKLNKGNCYVELASHDTDQTLSLKAYNSSYTTAHVGEYGIFVETASWPITYYLFAQSSPNMIICFCQYDTNKIENLMFGELVKVHSSAYIGGDFIHGSHLYNYPGGNGTLIRAITFTISNTDLTFSNGVGNGAWACSPIPFTRMSGWGVDVTGLHMEIDGRIWSSDTSADPYTSSNNSVYLTRETISNLYRGPNTWNSQTNLIPINLHKITASSRYMYLGYIEHIRLIRIDNYELGDIITIGSDRWKVFPWVQKNSVYRNGGGPISHSGTLGAAVRYDGP